VRSHSTSVTYVNRAFTLLTLLTYCYIFTLSPFIVYLQIFKLPLPSSLDLTPLTSQSTYFHTTRKDHLMPFDQNKTKPLPATADLVFKNGPSRWMPVCTNTRITASRARTTLMSLDTRTRTVEPSKPSIDMSCCCCCCNSIFVICITHHQQHIKLQHNYRYAENNNNLMKSSTTWTTMPLMFKSSC